MDHILVKQKFKAVNKFKKNPFLIRIRIVVCLTALACSFTLFCVTVLLWLPSLCSSMKFLSMSLPNLETFIINPKLLLIVWNIIIVFLLGELKLYLRKSVPVTEICDEYIKRNSSIPRLPTLEDIKESKELKLLEYFPLIEEGVKDVIEERGDHGRGEEEMEREEDFPVIKECCAQNLIYDVNDIP